MPKQYEKDNYISGKTFKLALSQGLYATVDLDHKDIVLAFTWCAASDRNGYTIAQTTYKDEHGKKKSLKLHHLIAGTPLKGHCIDHINGDPLDNRRANLRPCTKAQNNRNRHKIRGEVSYKGVRKVGERYRAEISHQNKRKSLGYHDTPEEAALAYNEAARLYHGEFAYLNDVSAALALAA